MVPEINNTNYWPWDKWFESTEMQPEASTRGKQQDLTDYELVTWALKLTREYVLEHPPQPFLPTIDVVNGRIKYFEEEIKRLRNQLGGQ